MYQPFVSATHAVITITHSLPRHITLRERHTKLTFGTNTRVRANPTRHKDG